MHFKAHNLCSIERVLSKGELKAGALKEKL